VTERDLPEYYVNDKPTKEFNTFFSNYHLEWQLAFSRKDNSYNIKGTTKRLHKDWKKLIANPTWNSMIPFLKNLDVGNYINNSL